MMDRYTHDIEPILLAAFPQIPWQRNEAGTPLMKRLGHGGFMCAQAVAEIPNLNNRGAGILLIDWDTHTHEWLGKRIAQAAEAHMGNFSARYGTTQAGIPALAYVARLAIIDAALQYIIAENWIPAGQNRAWGLEAKAEMERLDARNPWFESGKKEKALAIRTLQEQILEKVFGACLLNVSKDAGLLSFTTTEAGATSLPA